MKFSIAHSLARSFKGFVGACAFVCIMASSAWANEAAPRKTYCNPLNLDYGYCPIPNFVQNGKHRATADPVIVPFGGDYYLFSTNQWGYWWSSDLSDWHFVPRKFLKLEHQVYDELCAPGAFVKDNALFLIGSTHTKDFPLYRSINPKRGEWSEAVGRFEGAAWDPAFFVDDDGRIYLYYGSSNTFPIYGCELDAKTLQPKGPRAELIRMNLAEHGWERFGEANDQTFLTGFIEGAAVNKHQGRYYLQYAAPGTEFSGYGDGVYTSDKPLGPYVYEPYSPFCYKPGGFARGAGHGATFQDHHGDWWHVGTSLVCDKNNFERRLALWPSGFDEEGVLYCNTAYGDYPHFLPEPVASTDARRPPDKLSGQPRNEFTGWMLLNYAKPVQVSSSLSGRPANLAVDEDIRTYWSAESNRAGEFLQVDLGQISTIRAIQINYADQDAELMGKPTGIYHQYRLLQSKDGIVWDMLIDKSTNDRDIPHDYVALEKPAAARFIKLENVHMPTGKFAISGLRVFGNSEVPLPEPVEGLQALRGDHERRNAWLRWKPAQHATGYVVRFGVHPTKLYGSIMVYGSNEYVFRGMNSSSPYYFTVESFNEAGVSAPSEGVECP